MSDLLDAIRRDKNFKAVMEEALRKRPIVPDFALCKSKDEQEMVIENLKFHTAMKQGWDLLFTYLTGNKP